ncbi:hypothetical protein Pfo_024437 [Paulownia fortunei]|nr:hypothetical protein Pfo_024437 [Paulownia fortunei]
MVMGTYYCYAPEYAMTGQLTVKSDVYNFWVVFLSSSLSEKPLTAPDCKENKTFLHGKFAELADPRLQGEFPMCGLYQALALASIKRVLLVP